MGDAPSLALLSQTYPNEQVNTWIIAHLMDLYKFAGVKEKPSFQQVLELAVMIRVEYYYFKASELLLFFFKLKSGEYGTFYGVVDPMVIMAALIEFKGQRLSPTPSGLSYKYFLIGNSGSLHKKEPSG